MEHRTRYLLIALVAAAIAVWLALDVIGFLLKLLLLVAAIVVAVAAFRAWQRAGEGDARSTRPR